MITVWSGCDPQLAKAMEVFSETWGPYSAESRSHSIFSLIRDLIDPAWNDFRVRFPALNSSLMDCAWNSYQWERFRHLSPADTEEETPTQKQDRVKRSFIQCGGKIDGEYVFSEIARQHGFGVLDRFLHLVSQAMEKHADNYANDYEVTRSLDSLRELALACRLKKSKRKSHGKINTRRARQFCQSCGEQTELSAHLSGTAWPVQDEDERLRLSSTYCTAHRPKAPFSEAVKADYFRAKRSQSKFDQEFIRLERQSWGNPATPRAKSGSKLVDEYICRLAAHRQLGIASDQSNLDSIDKKLREEARQLVDRKISDRKKEIVMLLASGLNQSETALRLGIQRQAVSKILQSIPSDYRLDLHCQLPTEV